MKKKMLCLIISIIFILSMLAGCGLNKDSKTSNNATDLYSDKSPMKSTMTEMSKVLKDKSGVNVNNVLYSDLTSYETTIQQSIGNTQSPGLFTWWSGDKLTTLAKSGAIMDLTNEWKNYYIKDGVNPSLANAFKVNGKVYAAPFSVLYYGIFYNKKVFNKYGLKPPTTFNEFLNVCNTLVANGIIPIDMQNLPWVSSFWFQQIVASYSPDAYRDLVAGKISYTNPKIVAAMKILQQMLQKKYFSQPGADTGYKNFAAGKVAMVYYFNSTSAELQTGYNLIPKKDYDIFFLPSMHPKDKPVIFFEAAPIVISNNSSQKDSAVKALRNYYDKDVQQIMANEQGVVNTNKTTVNDPVIKGMLANANDTSKYQLLMRYYESTPTNIVNFTDDALWKFMANPDDATLNTTLNNIQANAKEVWSTK